MYFSCNNLAFSCKIQYTTLCYVTNTTVNLLLRYKTAQPHDTCTYQCWTTGMPNDEIFAYLQFNNFSGIGHGPILFYKH